MYGSKRFFLFFFLFILSFSIISAQDDIPKLEYGLYKNEDLLMKQWEADTSAEAAVLGETGHLYMRDDVQGRYYGFDLTVQRRIKILKKEAFDRANIVLHYYSGERGELISKVKAHTIAVNGEKHVVNAKDIRTEKLNKDESAVKFTFPAVTEGVILEYEYTLTSSNAFRLKPWYFQEDIPTRFSVLNFNSLLNFEYVYLFQGQENLKSTKPKIDKSSKINNIIFYVKDLPAIKDETFTTSIKDYLTHIKFQVAKFYSSTGAVETYLPTWEKTESDFLANNSIGKKYLKKSNFDEIASAAKNAYNVSDSAKLKILKLYNWVNTNIKCNNEYGWDEFSPNDIWTKKKEATYADMNYIFIALLRDAGLEANPVLLSPRHYGKPYTDSPITDQFIHCLTAIDLPNNQRFLVEAGRPNLPFGLPSVSSLNGKGWLLKKGASQWIDIKPSQSATIMLAKMDLTAEGNLVGTVTNQSKGYAAQQNREDYKGDASAKNRVAAWLKKYSDWKIDSFTPVNLDKIEESSFKEDIRCTIVNAAQVNDDMVYLKPALKSGWEINPFKLENRTYPVDMPYPTNDQYTLVINIPKGYKVEELPKPFNLGLPPNDARFQYQVTHDAVNNSITVFIKIQVNETYYKAQDYSFLRNFFSQVSAKLEEMIVLKKAGS